jgi:L-threonylcarbamoyladenylate synthase
MRRCDPNISLAGQLRRSPTTLIGGAALERGGHGRIRPHFFVYTAGGCAGDLRARTGHGAVQESLPHVTSHVHTDVLKTDPDVPDAAVIAAAARVLSGGGLVAFATETVYGLGALAVSPAAVARIFAAKGRPAVNPLIVHVAGIAQAKACAARWPDAAEALARRFWPGPLTLVLERSSIIPDVVTAGKHTVAVRVPAAKLALALIERAGQPIAAPSANRSNRLSPTRAAHVLADLDGLVDLVIDSGPTALGLESTVLDLTTATPRILRSGPLAAAEIEQALGGVPVLEAIASESSASPSSPGQMAVHYAPQTPSFRADRWSEVEGIAGRAALAVIAFGLCEGEARQVVAGHLFELETPEAAARRLYDVLHECDGLKVDAIIVVMPPDEPPWRAIRDRLLRATRPISELIGQPR